MTQQYLELYRKAYQLADLFEYDLIVYDGIFDFYNSPCFRSFRFEVNPESFDREDVEHFLYDKFEERKKDRK